MPEGLGLEHERLGRRKSRKNGEMGWLRRVPSCQPCAPLGKPSGGVYSLSWYAVILTFPRFTIHSTLGCGAIVGVQLIAEHQQGREAADDFRDVGGGSSWPPTALSRFSRAAR